MSDEQRYCEGLMCPACLARESGTCGRPVRPVRPVAVETAGERIAAFLKVVADARPCSGPTCGATIYWLRTKAGRAAPFNGDLTSHFATCPDVRRFKR